MPQKSLLIISSKLTESSYLRLQLGIQDAFSFRFGPEPYQKQVKEKLKPLINDYDFFFTDEIFCQSKVEKILSQLSNLVNGWHTYRKIILFPTELLYHRLGRICSCPSKNRKLRRLHHHYNRSCYVRFASKLFI